MIVIIAVSFYATNCIIRNKKVRNVPYTFVTCDMINPEYTHNEISDIKHAEEFHLGIVKFNTKLDR